MYDNFKTANYNNSLVSPEFYARPLSRLFSGDIIDGLTVVPGTGLQVTLQPGNTFLRYGSAAVASARIVSLVADFNLTIPTPDASNPRNDLVVVYCDLAVTLPTVDSTHPPTSANLDGLGVTKAKIVSGTPAASPVDPTLVAVQASVGAGNPYTIVSRVRTDVGVSVIAGGKITDLRKQAALGSQKIDFTTINSATGVISTTTTTTTGNKVITGLGFKPIRVKFIAEVSASSSALGFAEGEMTAATQYTISIAQSGASYHRNYSSTACMGYGLSGTAAFAFLASYVSFDSDGFTINVSMASNVWAIRWIAYQA